VTAWRLVAALVLTAACHRRPAPPLPVVNEVAVPSLPAAEPPWVGTLAAVRAAVDSGRFATADTILATFEQAQTGTSDANESAFWRAMLRADPRNPAFTPADARAALEGYLTLEGAQRRTEASVMLRLLALSDSLRTVQAGQRAAAAAEIRSRDEELQKLRDDLARTQAELDRIKRRLGAPRP
jgi:hypothetical protein